MSELEELRQMKADMQELRAAIDDLRVRREEVVKAIDEVESLQVEVTERLNGIKQHMRNAL